jgi:hypothetical protein
MNLRGYSQNKGESRFIAVMLIDRLGGRHMDSKLAGVAL